MHIRTNINLFLIKIRRIRVPTKKKNVFYSLHKIHSAFIYSGNLSIWANSKNFRLCLYITRAANTD